MAPAESDELGQLQREFEIWRRTSPAGSAIPARFACLPVDQRVWCRIEAPGPAPALFDFSAGIAGRSLVMPPVDAESGMP
jgi:hypothetical protein